MVGSPRVIATHVAEAGLVVGALLAIEVTNERFGPAR